MTTTTRLAVGLGALVLSTLAHWSTGSAWRAGLGFLCLVCVARATEAEQARAHPDCLFNKYDYSFRVVAFINK